MCELQWDALAEISLKRQENLSEICCLCSRVFIRNKDILKANTSTTELSASEEEIPIDEDFVVEPECNATPNTQKYITKQDNEHENLSCYCSASHTDNLSTDEHDSLRDSHDPITHIKGLQHSDSGADLTECLRHDIESDWQTFWSLNGEKLIWESWIAKYSAYINPEYLQYSQEQAPSDIEQNIDTNESNKQVDKFTFDEKELRSLNADALSGKDLKTTPIERCEQDCKNRVLRRDLSGSDDKLFNEVSEGWNPLSPVSIDCETEVERLLSSRCGSYASSSLRTVDSMTNVTRMTVSSIDLSYSTSSSDSFSSVSSVQSSLSSEESEEDYQHQWNVLWKKHYEEEYLEQYNKFIASTVETNVQDQKESLRLSTNIVLKNQSGQSGLLKKNIHKVFQGKVADDGKPSSGVAVVSSLDSLLHNLKMSESSKRKQITEDGSSQSDNEDDSTIHTEMAEMAALGLPASFGNIQGTKKPIQGISYENRKCSLGKSNSFISGRDRIHAAFNLIGIEFQEGSNEPMTGQVDYKMKHIRLQNRHLKIRPVAKKPKHTYFDDDGNALPESDDSKTFEESMFSDSTDNSGDEELIPTTPPKFDEKFDQNTSVKKKKRKKKPSFPPEIKENSKLRKYWQRRFSLFYKFDQGIKLDEESWYSVTPELVAKHTAERCRCDVIVDAFCGAGGNTIQFALTCNRVIAIDVDPKKIEIARNNAQVYGVLDKIDFIIGDFLTLSESIKADAVFLSPPWGGPSYLKQKVYELEEMLQPVPLSQLLKAARNVSNNIAAFLPRNSNTYALVNEAGPGGNVEIEQNFINKKLIAITAYYNDLIKEK